MTSRFARSAMAVGQGGWVGVDLFFTLSGFLITGILLDTREHEGYLKNFYVRRALRIFPLYYGVFLVLFLLTPVLHLQWRAGHIAYLFYAGNIAYGIDPTLANVRPSVLFLHLWSLAVEEQFYLIWPWVILLVARRRSLVWVCFGLSALALVLRSGLMIALPLTRAYEWDYAMLPTHMDGLLYGALAAVWIRSQTLESIVRRARPISLIAAATMAVIYGRVGFDFYSPVMMLAGFPVLAILFASVLLQALVPGSWASRLGSIPILRFFGKYSYGMYIFHILFMPEFAKYQVKLQMAVHSTLAGGLLYDVLTLAGTCVISVLSYQMYEKRWLGLKKRFEYKASPAQPQTAIQQVT